MKYLLSYKIFEQDSDQTEQYTLPQWLLPYTNQKYKSSKGLVLSLETDDVYMAAKMLDALKTVQRFKFQEIDVNEIDNVTDLQKFLINEMKLRNIDSKLVDQFGPPKHQIGKYSKSQFLEKLRNKLLQYYDPTNSTKKIKEKLDKMLPETSLAYMYNQFPFIFPIFGNSHPIETSDNFKNLFIGYWSKGTCPKNWESKFNETLQNFKSANSPAFEVLSKLGWKDYGTAESEWISNFAIAVGLIPNITKSFKGGAVYEYYNNLTDTVEGEVGYNEENFADGQFGKMTLFALTEVYNALKNQMDQTLTDELNASVDSYRRDLRSNPKYKQRALKTGKKV
jgi:hypothetical protein